jgi:serine/threonine-protein kinase
MKDGSRQVVMEGMARAYYVPPGYLVYAEIDLDSGTTTGGVWATAFDLQRLRPVGKPVRLFDGVNVTDNSTQMLVTANGMLTYLPGPAVANSRRLIWVARDGREDALDVPPGSYVYPRLSPDGRRVAANTQDDSGTIWVLDLERGIRDRLTAGPSSAREPVWTPDGKRIIFSTLEGPVSRVVAKTVDGVESDVVLEATDGRRAPLAVSADGRVLIIYKARGPGVGDLSLVSLDRPGTETPFLRDASNADLSPDGRWVVYQSRESGRDEIYVRRFPSADGRQLVSSGGGSRPLWRQNGREILYLDPRRNVMAVSVETEPALRLGRPTMVFERELPDFAGLRPPGRTFDVSPDGQRILMIRPELGKAAGDLVVALHWIEELKRRLPIAP